MHRSREGFTLIELSIVLLILGVIIVGVIALLPLVTERMRLIGTETGFGEVDEAITGFALTNTRLPCPDTDDDGLEGGAGGCVAADVVGTVPFRSLGLPGPALDEARLPLRYAVYRNSGADADLTELTELFEPALPAALTVTPGSVLGCGTIVPNQIQIVYDGPADSTLTFSNASGTFQTPYIDTGPNPDQPVPGEYVGGAWIDYSSPAPGMAPYPLCFCGNTGATCNQCPDFIAGEKITGSVSGATATIDSFDTPGATINIGLPAGPFMVGETITGQSSYFAATADSFTNPIVQVQSLSGNTMGVNLIPAPPAFPGFRPNQKIFGASSGTTATYISLTPPVITNFTSGEQIVGGSSGATGTVVADSGALLTVNVTGGSFQVGETITGQSSGTEGTIVSITTDIFAEPVITRGTIDWSTPSLSGATNRLDYCQSLRNAITAAGTTGSTGYPHTVNPDAIPINPAYLLASGGVEDANGNAVDGSFDSLNEITSPLDFVSPAPGRRADYDDLVFTAPIGSLEERLCCAENIGAVNALAVDATVMQNVAIVAFYRNEQALQLVDQSYQALKLSEANCTLSIVLTSLNALGLAVKIAHTAMHGEVALPAYAAIAIALVALAADVVNLVMACTAVPDAEAAYAASCTSQTATANALGPALADATNALGMAIQADAAGGVK